METTDYLRELSRKAEAASEEVRALVAKIDDIPVRISSDAQSVYRELMQAGSDRHVAWDMCTRIIGQRQEIGRRLAQLQAEIKVLTAMANDTIGKSGRLL